MKLQEMREVTVVKGSADGSTNIVTIAVPMANEYQVEFLRQYVTIGEANSPSAAADIGTITVSMDGTNFGPPDDAAATTVDTFTTTNIRYIVLKGHYTHIRINTASIVAANSTEWAVSCISNR